MDQLKSWVVDWSHTRIDGVDTEERTQLKWLQAQTRMTRTFVQFVWAFRAPALEKADCSSYFANLQTYKLPIQLNEHRHSLQAEDGHHLASTHADKDFRTACSTSAVLLCFITSSVEPRVNQKGHLCSEFYRIVTVNQ